LINKKFDIALADGQDHLKNKIFRIAHLGFGNAIAMSSAA
jgi:aspartate aminotransferase-like enzyme